MITYENNVKLKGVVNHLKSTKVDSTVIGHNFMLSICHTHKSKDGSAFVEITWVPVSYLSSSEDIQDGDNVSVEGVLTSRQYQGGEDSSVKTFLSVKAKTIKKL